MIWKQKSISIFLGLIFLLSGVGKMLNVILFQDLINQLGIAGLHLLAPLIIWIELVLAFTLCFQIHLKQVSLASIILLIIFTGVYTFGYVVKGVTDCGCFGSFTLFTTSPMFVYVRNISMIIAANYLYFSKYQLKSNKSKWIKIVAIIFAVTIAFITGISFHPFAFTHQEHPWKDKTITELNLPSDSTGSQNQLYFFYTFSCPHCLNSIENILATQRYGIVDTIKAFAISDDISATDSIRKVWEIRYPNLKTSIISSKTYAEINAFPTTLIVKHDSIVNVWIGEVPSPYTIAIQN
ncbi:MAG: hypothetical protein MJZ84_02585 [Paludibacteraceae bacterium]|nr:hypothetical protein [Paludibacteraceae bacterium]